MARIAVSRESDVVAAVRAARESRRSMEIMGRGTKRRFGRPVECDDVLDLSGLAGIVKYEPDELVITARAGTPVAEIEAALAEKNQRLGFEPADWGPLFGAPANSATIGGTLAAAADGSASVKFGRARAHLLGFRAVNGWGEAYKAGGQVVKNVTGFDLPKLMCGAMGTLGPLTEVTLRVFPKSSTGLVFAIGGLSETQGLAALRRVWASALEASGLALLSWDSWRHFSEIKETEDAEYERDWTDEEYTTNNCAALFRIEGADTVVKEKMSAFRAVLERFNPIEIPDGAKLFRLINSGTAFVDTMEDVWLWHVPPDEAGAILSHKGGTWIADWAGSRIWGRGTPGYSEDWHREQAAKAEGSVTLIRASEQTRMRVAPFAPERAVRAELTRRVKAAFDPLGLFNPGRMWEGV